MGEELSNFSETIINKMPKSQRKDSERQLYQCKHCGEMFEKRGLDSHQKSCKAKGRWVMPYTNVSWCIFALIAMVLAPRAVIQILDSLAAMALIGNGAADGALEGLSDAAKKVGEVVENVTSKPDESAKAAKNAFSRFPTTIFDAFVAGCCGLWDYNKPRLINGSCVS